MTATAAFPWVPPRPLVSSFRRASVEQPGAIAHAELIAALAILLARHDDALAAVVGCVRRDGDRLSVVPVRVELGEAATYAGTLAAVDATLTADATPDGPPHELPVLAASVGEPAELRTALAASDLAFVADRTTGVLRCDYRAELFDEAIAHHLLEQVQRVTAEGRAHPARALRELDLVGERQRASLLTACAATEQSAKACPEALVQAQALVHPERLAVTAGPQQLSYRELERQANGVALRLRELGVTRGDRVGVRVGRSCELVVALLGVLKAGAAYVPIDPDAPRARQQQVAELAQIRLLLVAGSDAAPLDGVASEPVSLEGPGAPDGPAVAVDPSDAAYVLFTSGSTGVPKGVEISRHSVARLFSTTAPLFACSCEDVWLNAHTFTFDASVWEIFGALTSGGRVVIAPREIARDPEAMVDLVRREGVSVLTISPTAFDGFRDAALERDEPFAALRFVVLCAEALTPAALTRWFERWGDERPALWNMYGITETTVHSTVHRLGWADARDTRRRIGRGLPDTPVYVLDGQRRLAPYGVPGEIYVGGPGVASGYLVAPAADHERFAADPFAPLPGGRLYRSGDRGRWLPDGTIEYLGRLDRQVKIRGFRIELGEVEAALLDCPGVRAVRAWVVRTEGLPPRLAAAVIAVPGTAVDPEQVRAFARERLPEYMVPAGVVLVAELPQTRNGKLDEQRLPDPFARPSTVAAAPTGDPLETAIAAAFSAVLEIEQPDADASFFELGGDSITAIRLIVQLRRAGFEADLPHVYELRSPRALARALGRAADGRTAPVAPFELLDEGDARWVPSGALDAFPATRLQRGMLFHIELDGEHVYHDVLSYTLDELVDEAPFRAALEAATAAHPALRSSFVVAGPAQPLQVVHPAAQIACTFEDTSGRPPGWLETWAAHERSVPFELGVPGLMRVFVHRTGPAESVLSLSVHHAILDGWSVATLVTELLSDYASRRRGDAAAARAQPGDGALARYAALERDAERHDGHRAFWERQLEGARPSEPPGLRRTDRAQALAPMASASFAVPAAVAQRLLVLAREAGGPPKTAYLAAHIALLSFLAGEQDVLTGIVTSGRSEEDGGDEALGLFLNTVPLRVPVGARTWRELLGEVFESESRVYRHRRLPLERIQAAAGIADACPTAFNYTSFHVYERLAAAGIRLRDIRYREETNFLLLTAVDEDPFTHATRVTLSFRPSLIGAAQAQRQLDALQRLVHHMAEAPDEPAVDAIAEWARRNGRTARVQAGAVEDVPGSALALVQETLRRRPDAVAVLHEEGAATYRDVAARAELARRGLLDVGVRAGDRVACFLEPGLDPLAALLAVWAAGASYVPIGAELPLARQRLLLECVGCRAALRSRALPREQLAWQGPELELGGEPDVALAADAASWVVPRAADEAYVLFTSGSTGVPKAVSMHHRGIANLIAWQIAQPELARPARVSQFASLSFDVSIQELLSSAASGSTLVAVPPAVRRNPQELLELIVARGVEVAFLPVVALHQLALAWQMFGSTPTALHTIVTAGEALVVTDAVRDFCAAAGAELVNQYGPTETHVVTHHRLGPDPRSWPERPPIGRPIRNIAAHVLDARRRPVPQGTPGELHIAGAGVASGYVTATGTEPATGERFVTAADGTLLYRTGDIVDVSGDELEYVGRVDDQLKIRGHRVEPGEVVAAIARHPAVRGVAVVPSDGTAGHRSLVAYVVAGDGATAEQLIAHARAALPDYAVPTHVELLDRLPTTPSGKVDVRALAGRRSAGGGRAEATPPTRTERRVLAAWSAVLGHEVTSATVSFFDAGGSSLLLLSLHSRLRHEFERDFPVHDLFRFPTAQAFARFLDQDLSSPTRRPKPSRTPHQIAAVAARTRSARNPERRNDG